MSLAPKSHETWTATCRLLDPPIYKHSRHSHHCWPLVVLVVAVAVLLVASDFSNNKNCSLSSWNGWFFASLSNLETFCRGGHYYDTKTWTQTPNNTTIVWETLKITGTFASSLILHPKKNLAIWMFPKMVGFPPKSSILIGFSIINHPFWGTPIFGNTHVMIPVNDQLSQPRLAGDLRSDRCRPWKEIRWDGMVLRGSCTFLWWQSFRGVMLNFEAVSQKLLQITPNELFQHPIRSKVFGGVNLESGQWRYTIQQISRLINTVLDNGNQIANDDLECRS